MNARVPLDRAIASATCIPRPRQEPVMSAVDKTTASDAEFQARIARFAAVPVPPEGWEQRVEVAARAMWEDICGANSRDTWDEIHVWTQEQYRRLAAAALTADATLAGQHSTDEEADRG